MSERHQIWIVVVLIAAVAIGAFVLDRWVAGTAGRTDAALAIANSGTDWLKEGAAARDQAGKEIAAKCDQYLRVRSGREAEVDNERWLKRHRK